MQKMLPEFEDRYRQSYLEADIKQAKLGVLLLIIPLFLLLFEEHMFFGLSLEFYCVTALRLGFVVYSVLFIAYLNRLKSYRSYFKSEFEWGFVGIVSQLIVNASLPQDFVLHILTVITIIFVIYLVIPQTFVNRIIMSLTITLGELVIIIYIPSLEIITFFALVFSLIMVNIIGVSCARVFESYRIKAFKAQEEISNLASERNKMNEKLRIVSGLTRHDVRNKLSSVTTCAYFLKKRHAEKTDIVEGLEKMEQAVKDVITIFDFAKMYEQLGVEELTYVDAEIAVNEAAALFPDLTIKLINDCHGLSLLADSFLRQLFYNFIDNTWKYGKKATTVRVYYEKGVSGELRLIYEDDGAGITAENKLKLFTEGFSTGDSTGFGLFLSKKMIDVYGWQIQESGEPNKGAKFVITIPRVNKDGKETFKIA